MVMACKYKKLGSEKIKVFDENFDKLYDKYKSKAKEMGYDGKIKFQKERANVVIFVEI
jgi:hypothetical protein